MYNTTTLNPTFDSAAFTEETMPLFVVRDTAGGMVQGIGNTAQAAWTDAIMCLDLAGVTVVEDEPADHTEVRNSSLVVLEVLAN